MTFQFRGGERLTQVPAEIVGAALAAIHQTHGSIRPAIVVEEAEPDDAPLHPVFEWDDTLAGHEFRLIQARKLIRSVFVTRDDPIDKEPRQVYVHVGVAEGYQPIDVVVTRPDQYEAALSELQRRFDSADSALKELRRAAEGVVDADRLAAISLAVQAFATVREAIAILGH